MLTMKRPKEGVFTEREEGRINSSKDKCARRASRSRTGSGSDYTLETMGSYGRILSLETMWHCLYFRVAG